MKISKYLYLVPVASLGVLLATASRGTVQPQDSQIQQTLPGDTTETRTETSETGANLTVNGQNVPLTNGRAEVKTESGSTHVEFSAPADPETLIDGVTSSLNVSVTSSNNSNTRTTTRLKSSSSSRISGGSHLEISSDGPGTVTVTDND